MQQGSKGRGLRGREDVTHRRCTPLQSTRSTPTKQRRQLRLHRGLCQQRGGAVACPAYFTTTC